MKVYRTLVFWDIGIHSAWGTISRGGKLLRNNAYGGIIHSLRLKKGRPQKIMGAQHVIELNGKRYDTTTGKLVSSSTVKPPTAGTAKHADIIRPKANKSRSAQAKSVNHPKARSTTPNHVKRQTQHSKTIMRTAALAHPVSLTPSEPTGFLSAADPRTALDTERLKRAKAIHQNRFIGRFEAKASPAVTAPSPVPTPITVPTKPASIAPASQPAQSAPVSRLEAAVALATSHEQVSPKKKNPVHHKIARKLHVKPRTLSAATATLLIFAVGGLVTYQNMPQIKARVAMKQAGVQGSIPSQIPAGFRSQNAVNHKEGEVSFSYVSNTDARSFTITQTQSFWTSESLRQNYVDPLGVDYQTLQENGKTIYLYGNNATWVDGGVWYRVENKDGSLSSLQLQNIIKGL